MQTRSLTKKLVVCALFVAIGIALQIIESMIPMPINIPGGKIGLANIITLILLYVFDFKSAIVCALLRAFLGSLLSGGIFGAVYSISGAAFAAVMMEIAIKIGKGRLTEIGVSVIGAAAHNSAQVFVASLVLSDIYIFTYLPPLVIASCITGIFTGFAAKFSIKNIEKTGIF